MITKIILIVGLPGSGKTTYAKSIMTDSHFLIDDPNRDRTLFDKAKISGKSIAIICDPLLITSDRERVMNFLRKKFDDGIDFDWIYFENDPHAAWHNHLIRNESDPRSINEKFHKQLSNNYIIPDDAKTIPVYKSTKE